MDDGGGFFARWSYPGYSFTYPTGEVVTVPAHTSSHVDAPMFPTVTQADIDRWRTDPWSIDFPLADDGTPPGFRYAGDGWIDTGRREPAVADWPSTARRQ